VTKSEIAAAAVAPPTPKLRGGLHWIMPRKLSGWAICPARPHDHLRVEVRLDGVLIATTRACQRLDPLTEIGIKAGDHGFLVETAAPLPADEPERLEVMAFTAEGASLELRLPHSAPPRARGSGAGSLRFVAADRAQRPVFVLGAARSGTSVMGRALRRTGRYEGHGEGHLISLLPALLAATSAHYQRDPQRAASGRFTMLASVPEQVIQDGLQAMFAAIARAEFPSANWMDKTPGPEMVRGAPVLRRVWPAARFIFMKRRGIDNIQSRRRKFPELAFAEHCQAWADSMQAWEAVRGALAGVSLEVEQTDVALRPQAVVRGLKQLLGLKPAEAAQMLQAFRTDRPQQTDDSFAAAVAIADTGWDDAQRAQFRAICGPAMARFGYAETPDATAIG
jgi:hypothetical protein